MATTTKALVRASFATSLGTLYTVPGATTTVVTNIAITNAASSAATFTLYLNGMDLFVTTAIAANSTTIVDLKQVLTGTQTISGFASATTVKVHISGVEIS